MPAQVWARLDNLHAKVGDHGYWLRHAEGQLRAHAPEDARRTLETLLATSSTDSIEAHLLLVDALSTLPGGTEEAVTVSR